MAESRVLALRQTWLSWHRRRIGPRAISRFLKELVAYAGNEVQRVHGLVLPELALDGTDIVAIAEELARTTDLELFVAGILVDSRHIHPFSAEQGLLRNFPTWKGPYLLGAGPYLLGALK